MILSPTQELAIARALDVSQRVVAITGEAGTGKTTILARVYNALSGMGYNPVVCAPTGRAARRVKQATGIHAITIHKLLEYSLPGDPDPETGKPTRKNYPSRNGTRKLEYDTIIVDEAGMINRELYTALRDAFPKGGRLIAFGDNRQLPPVEKSPMDMKPVFQEWIEKFDGVVLDRVYRQEEGSAIIAAASRVLRGLPPINGDGFTKIMTTEPIDELRKLLTKDYALLSNQIITPANTSWVGTYKLSVMVQGELFTDYRETVQLPRHQYHDHMPVSLGIGDKVIMTKNWYGLERSDGEFGLMNGDTGIISEIGDDYVTMQLDDDLFCRVPFVFLINYADGKSRIGYPIRDLQLAYAITTHKSQGAEYDNVIYVINRSVIRMCNRRNIYTALTRARKKAILITDMKALSDSLFYKEPRVFAE